MKARQQNSTSYPIEFLMVDSADHITGKTGLTPTVTISKNGASFGSPSGAVTEVGSGWYSLAGNATDRNTVGEFLIHATGTGADPADDKYLIVPFDPFDSAALGLSRLDATVGSRSTYAGGDTSGVTTLLSRIVGTLASGTHNPQGGDAYARLGAPAGASVSADVAAVKSDTDTLTGRITSGRATSLDNLDATVSSRSTLDAAAIRAAIGLAAANLDTQLSGIAAAVWAYGTRTLTSFGTLIADIWAYASRTLTAISDSSGITTLLSRLTSGRATNLDNLDAAVSTRLATSGYTAPPAVGAIADAVLDEALSGHLTDGSAGKALSDAAFGGDPLSVEVPGDYAPGTAGAILGALRAGGTITLVSPVDELTNEISIISGGDYTIRRPIDVVVPVGIVDLTGASIAFKLHTPTPLEVSATAYNLAQADQYVRIQLSAAQTAGLGTTGEVRSQYSIVATWSGPTEVVPFVYRQKAHIYPAA